MKTPMEIMQAQTDVIMAGLPKKMYFPSEATEIELVSCGHCEKMITPNLIASFGADHHDPDETMCESCFAGAIDTAEARAEMV